MDQIIDHGLFYMGIVGVKLYTNCTYKWTKYEILNFKYLSNLQLFYTVMHIKCT